MKNNFWKYGIIALALIFILGVVFVLRNLYSKPDVSPFITKESFIKTVEDCAGSPDKNCISRPSDVKIDKFCAEGKVSAEDCERIRINVNYKAIEYLNEYKEEQRQLTEKIKRATEEMKQRAK